MGWWLWVPAFAGTTAASAVLSNERQDLFHHPPELRHRIAHRRDAERDAIAAAILELLQMRDALGRRAVGQPRLQALLRVVGAVVQIEELLGVRQRRSAVVVHVDVVIENIVKLRDIAPLLAPDLEDELPRPAEALGADR